MMVYKNSPLWQARRQHALQLESETLLNWNILFQNILVNNPNCQRQTFNITPNNLWWIINSSLSSVKRQTKERKWHNALKPRINWNQHNDEVQPEDFLVN